MVSTQRTLNYILEQLGEIPGFSYQPMVGQFKFYSDGLWFGGIYDDRVLVKKLPENAKYKMKEVLPYEGALDTMYHIEDVDDREKLIEIITATQEGIRNREEEKRKSRPVVIVTESWPFLSSKDK